MDCENVVRIKVGKRWAKVACGHPLAVHDPCSVEGCPCRRYEPADRKVRAALITDTARPAPATPDQARHRDRITRARGIN